MSDGQAVLSTDKIDLPLSEGDVVVGEVRDGKLVFSVVASSHKEENHGKGFGTRWLGKFKGVADQDFSDDPRAQYILGR